MEFNKNMRFVLYLSVMVLPYSVPALANFNPSTSVGVASTTSQVTVGSVVTTISESISAFVLIFSVLGVVFGSWLFLSSLLNIARINAHKKQGSIGREFIIMGIGAFLISVLYWAAKWSLTVMKVFE